MKRMLALLLAFSMMFSLTLPAYAEEVVEEIAEEITEEVVEEVTEEEPAEPETEEIAEEIVEEAAEVPAEEVVEEVMAISDSSDVANFSAVSNNAFLLERHERGWFQEVETFVGRTIRGRIWLNGSEIIVDDTGVFGILTKDEAGNFVDAKENPPITITRVGTSAEYDIQVTQPGIHVIRYQKDNQEHDIMIRVLSDDETLFYATKKDGTGPYKTIWHDTTVSDYAGEDYLLWFESKRGEERIRADRLFSTMDEIILSDAQNDAVHIKLTAAKDGRIGFVEWQNEGRYQVHYLSVGFDGPNVPQDLEAEILFQEHGTETFVNSLTMDPGVPVSGHFFYGSRGARIKLNGGFQFLENNYFNFGPYNGNSENGFELEPGPLGASITIGFNGATFTASVPDPNPPVESSSPKLFNQRGDGSGNQICTYMDMRPGDCRNVKLWFGTSTANKKDVAGSVFVVEGDAITLTHQPQSMDYQIEAVNEGYSVIGYRDEENGPIYCMTIRVTSGDIDDNYQASNYVKIVTDPETGKGIESGMALKEEHGDTLKYYTRYGRYFYADDAEDSFEQELALLVMDKGNYVTLDSKMADGVTNRLSDIYFEVLGCNNAGAITMSAPYDYTESEASPIKTKAVTVTATPRTRFQATIAVSYTLDGTKRFTHQFELWRNPTMSDIEIYADDLDTAGKLNAVLSSWEAFAAWVTDKYGPFTVGQQVRVFLPPVSYDEVIVAQAFSPRNPESNQPFTLISIIGADNGPNTPKTTMCGLIEKASLASVAKINFVANGKTMTTTGNNEEFTCGILTDYKNTFRPVYDNDYLKEYAGIDVSVEGYQLPSLVLPASRIKDYGNIFNTSIDLSQVAICNFSGFDYGVRSTKYGYTGNQQGNFYGSCGYGIYIDNNGSAVTGGDQGADGGNATSTNYENLYFEGNDTAVKIVTLPTDAAPNVVRIHDSWFIENEMEFDIEQEGNYYFYRNYFGDLRVDENNEVWHEPRAGHYHRRSKVKVILNPCRRSANMDDNTYWFYSGDDQHTVLEYGKPDILIHGDAMKELEGRADISVENNGHTEIVYTFYGKEGRK